MGRKSIKLDIDQKVYDRNDILRKDDYFEQTVMSRITEALTTLNIANDREDRLFIQSRIASQYLMQYHDNLPMALDCYISTKLSDIPFHLGTAEDLNIDERSIDGEKMRPTWVFNPLAIDFLPTEVIPIIKMELAKNNGVTEIVQNMSMGKTPESMAELYDAWETYTAILEKEIVGCLQLTAENKKQLIGQRAHCKNRKYVVEGMKCVLGFFPIIGEIINCFDALKVAWECFSWNVLQKRATKDTPLAHKVAIETYLKTMEVSNVKIITKFDKF